MPDACSDPAVCSRVISYGGTCLGATTVGAFCDSFGTPCAETAPDCAKLGAAIGVPATAASCGNGLSFCDVPWGGNLDAATVGRLCDAHAALGVPVDCMLD